jgi:hypothetical protein
MGNAWDSVLNVERIVLKEIKVSITVIGADVRASTHIWLMVIIPNGLITTICCLAHRPFTLFRVLFYSFPKEAPGGGVWV